MSFLNKQFALLIMSVEFCKARNIIIRLYTLPMFVMSYYRIILLDIFVFIYEKNYKLRGENLGKLTLFLGFLLSLVLKKIIQNCHNDRNHEILIVSVYRK